jgi:hypothetical protein
LALGFLATTARSDEITLSLPAELARPLADAVKHLRATASGERADRFEKLANHLAAGELRAPGATLRELLGVAIDETSDALSRASSRLLRGEEGGAAELRAHFDELGALLDLLESVPP